MNKNTPSNQVEPNLEHCLFLLKYAPKFLHKLYIVQDHAVFRIRIPVDLHQICIQDPNPDLGGSILFLNSLLVFCTIERQCSAVLCIQSLKEPKRFGWSRSSNEVSAPGQTREFIPASYILIARLSDAGPGYSATPGGNSLRN